MRNNPANDAPTYGACLDVCGNAVVWMRPDVLDDLINETKERLIDYPLRGSEIEDVEPIKTLLDIQNTYIKDMKEILSNKD